MLNYNKKKIKIVIIGCGNMGEAILSTWLDEGIQICNVYVIDPKPSKWLLSFKDKGLNINRVFPKDAEICLIAVKPQMINLITIELKKFDFKKTLFFSIVAGIRFKFFEENVCKDIRLIRAMPNTPAKIKKSITALIGNDNMNEEDFNFAKYFFSFLGDTIKIPKEELIDIVTAISGSGPAYIFYILETFIELAKNYGLSEGTAKKLIIETMIGSAHFAKISEKPLSKLRENVTSPGGTTEAALKVFTDNNNGFSILLGVTIEKAFLKSKELGSN